MNSNRPASYSICRTFEAQNICLEYLIVLWYTTESGFKFYLIPNLCVKFSLVPSSLSSSKLVWQGFVSVGSAFLPSLFWLTFCFLWYRISHVIYIFNFFQLWIPCLYESVAAMENVYPNIGIIVFHLSPLLIYSHQSQNWSSW